MSQTTDEATVITVQGSFESLSPAERATVTMTVGFQGPERGPVVDDTVRGTAALLDGVRLRQHEAGPVTWSSSDRIQVWTTRPHSTTGEQRPPVHHARTTTRVRFRDVDALAQWVQAAAAHPGVSVGTIVWDLTAATRQAARAAARARAVAEAEGKARDYATALGLTSVRCTALADPGMLGDRVQATGGGGATAFARGAAGGGSDQTPALSFTPEDIAVTATVDARFVAS